MGGNVLLKMSKNLHIPFAAMTNLTEGLCFNALLTAEVENSIICPVTRVSTVCMMECKLIWPGKHKQGTNYGDVVVWNEAF
jgi:hypothetical protein